MSRDELNVIGVNEGWYHLMAQTVVVQIIHASQGRDLRSDENVTLLDEIEDGDDCRRGIDEILRKNLCAAQRLLRRAFGCDVTRYRQKACMFAGRVLDG